MQLLQFAVEQPYVVDIMAIWRARDSRNHPGIPLVVRINRSGCHDEKGRQFKTRARLALPYASLACTNPSWTTRTILPIPP